MDMNFLNFLSFNHVFKNLGKVKGGLRIGFSIFGVSVFLPFFIQTIFSLARGILIFFGLSLLAILLLLRYWWEREDVWGIEHIPLNIFYFLSQNNNFLFSCGRVRIIIINYWHSMINNYLTNPSSHNYATVVTV